MGVGEADRAAIELLQKSTSILLAKSGPTAASKELNLGVVA